MRPSEIQMAFNVFLALLFAGCLWFAWVFCKHAGARVGEPAGMVIVFFMTLAFFETTGEIAVIAVQWAMDR